MCLTYHASAALAGASAVGQLGHTAIQLHLVQIKVITKGTREE